MITAVCDVGRGRRLDAFAYYDWRFDTRMIN